MTDWSRTHVGFGSRTTDRDLGFGLFLWFSGVLGGVTFFASSGMLPTMFVIGVAWFSVLAGLLLFPPLKQHALVLGLVALIGFNAVYNPIFGLFSSIKGDVSGLYRYVLGVRSIFFVVALFVATFVLYFKAKAVSFLSASCSLLMLVLGFVCVGLLLSKAAPTAKVTYMLNSYIPLILSIYLLGIVSFGGLLSADEAHRIVKGIAVVVFLGVVYFFSLPITYDIFRPDLASFMRVRPGEFIPYGGYDPSWGTRMFGVTFNRFVGTFPDPIVSGYFFSAFAFLSVVMKWKFLRVFFLALLLISLSKGAWLFFLQAYVIYILYCKAPRFVLPVWVSFVVFQLSLASVLDTSSRVHLMGLLGGINSVLQGGVKPFLIGFGVGDGGNLARAYVEGGGLGSGWLASGSESGVGVLAHQIGLGGVALLMALVRQSFKRLEISSEYKVISFRASYAVRALVLSLGVNMPLQENTINASIIAILILASLIVLSIDRPALKVSGKSDFSGDRREGNLV